MSKQDRVGTAVLNLPADLSDGMKCGESVELAILRVSNPLSSRQHQRDIIQSDYLPSRLLILY